MATTLSARQENEPEQMGETAWCDRLGLCADNIDGYHFAHVDEIEVRDRLIVQAVDLGWPQGQVSRWARISHARVTQILARPPEGN